MKNTLALLILITGTLLIPAYICANIGVGVGSGKIQVTQKLKPGTIYVLPPLTVINTGTEQSDYEVGVEYHEKQPQLIPPRTWFMFSPQKFNLKPGKAQVVNIKLNLPLRTKPGDYFAYLEGRPLIKAQSGQTSIGVAAAAKLYFTVIPGSVFEGIYYKLLSFWQVYAPWPQRATTALLVLGALFLFKNFFNIKIDLKKPAKGRSKDEEKE